MITKLRVLSKNILKEIAFNSLQDSSVDSSKFSIIMSIGTLKVLSDSMRTCELLTSKLEADNSLYK